MMDALESVIRYARTKLQEEVATMDDKTDAIACKGAVPGLRPGSSLFGRRCQVASRDRQPEGMHDRL